MSNVCELWGCLHKTVGGGRAGHGLLAAFKNVLLMRMRRARNSFLFDRLKGRHDVASRRGSPLMTFEWWCVTEDQSAPEPACRGPGQEVTLFGVLADLTPVTDRKSVV